MKNGTMTAHDKNGKEMTVAVRNALPVDSPCARYTGNCGETWPGSLIHFSGQSAGSTKPAGTAPAGFHKERR